MPVHVWWGAKPSDHDSEYAVLKELSSALNSNDKEYFIFANFFVTDAQIDFVVINESSIFLIELKHSAGLKISGGINGAWKRSDGKTLGDKNPIRQVIHQYQCFRDSLRRCQIDVFGKNKTASLEGYPDDTFKDIKKFIVLYPHKSLDTKIKDVDTRVQPFMGDIIGFDELLLLIAEGSWSSRLGIIIDFENIRKLAAELGLESADPTLTYQGFPENLSLQNLGQESISAIELPKHNFKARLIAIGLILTLVISSAIVVLFLSSNSNGNQCDKAVNSSSIQNLAENTLISVKLIPLTVNEKQLFGKWYIYLDGDTFIAVQIGPYNQKPGESTLTQYRNYLGKSIVVNGKFDTSTLGNRVDISPGDAIQTCN